MKITKVSIRPVKSNEYGLIAISSIVIDDELAINDIKLFEKRGIFSINFPNTPTAAALGKCNIAPLSSEARYKIEQHIIEQWLVQKRIKNWE